MATEAQASWEGEPKTVKVYTQPAQLIGAFYLHNNFTIQVESNVEGMDVLKALLMSHPLLKGFTIYTANEPGVMPRALEVVERVNYFKLKELRNGS